SKASRFTHSLRKKRKKRRRNSATQTSGDSTRASPYRGDAYTRISPKTYLPAKPHIHTHTTPNRGKKPKMNSGGEQNEKQESGMRGGRGH
ncbi:hypothetical protein KUCAC02_020726, partial [Chaenocephalus aceratus]